MPKTSVEEKRRREIMQAALRCFSQRGYYAATMDEVAATAHLSKALIYYYFKNKQELFLAVLDSWLAEFEQALEEVSASDSAAGKLRRLGFLSAEAAERSAELMNLLFEFWAQAGREPDLMESFSKALRRYRKWITDVIEDGINDGEFRQVDPQLAAVGLAAALDGLWAHWMLDPQEFSFRQACEVMVENFLRGIGKDAV